MHQTIPLFVDNDHRHKAMAVTFRHHSTLRMFRLSQIWRRYNCSIYVKRTSVTYIFNRMPTGPTAFRQCHNAVGDIEIQLRYQRGALVHGARPTSTAPRLYNRYPCSWHEAFTWKKRYYALQQHHHHLQLSVPSLLPMRLFTQPVVIHFESAWSTTDLFPELLQRI